MSFVSLGELVLKPASKLLAQVAVAGLVGPFLADVFVIRYSASDSGFVDYKPGTFHPGMAGVANAAAVALAFIAARKVIK